MAMQQFCDSAPGPLKKQLCNNTQWNC